MVTGEGEVETTCLRRLRVAEGSAEKQRPVVLMRHYHVVEHAVGEQQGYREEVFRSRRRALMSARARAEWLGAVAGLRVESLVGGGRYLITSGRPGDAGRLITVEDCHEAECLVTR
jgi:uncharacterized protein YbjQ (UPF0145 family)